jgi:hypothetical protein
MGKIEKEIYKRKTNNEMEERNYCCKENYNVKTQENI